MSITSKIQDSGVEKNFAEIIGNLLDSKLPSMSKYAVGIQLIDAEDDGSKAFGIAAFILGESSWVYVPVIFNKGETDGYNLLYLKQADIFWPASENIIAILADKDMQYLIPDLGDLGEDADTISDIEVPGENNQGNDGSIPGEDSTEESGEERTASDANALVDRDTLRNMFRNRGGVALGNYAFPKFAERFPKVAADCLYTMKEDPEFANHVLRFVTPEELRSAYMCIAPQLEKRAQSDEPTDPAEKDLEVFTGIDESAKDRLSDAEKGVLLQEGFYVKDERPEFSTVFRTSVTSDVVHSISKPGLYDIFMSDFRFRPGLVLYPENSGEPYVVFPDRPEVAACPNFSAEVPSSANSYPGGRTDDQYRFGSLGTHKDMGSSLVRAETSRLQKGPYGRDIPNTADSPFKGKQGGMKANMQNLTSALAKEARGDRESRYSTCTFLVTQGLNRVFTFCASYDSAEDPKVKTDVEFTGKDGKLVKYGDTLYIPSGAVMFRVASPKESSGVSFGSLDEVDTYLRDMRGLEKVQLRSEKGRFTHLTYAQEKKASASDMDAVLFLAEKCGIYAGNARQIVREAHREGSAEYYVKECTSLHKTAAEGGIESMRKHPDGEKTTPLKPEKLRTDVVKDIQDASGAGIREVFDVSMWKSLLSDSTFEDTQKEEVSDYIRNMDRLGRRLFFLYVNRDEMENRYGRDSLPELEATLEETFRNMGDIIMFLRERSNLATDEVGDVVGELSEEYGGAYGETE
jgi:hypothetical protein